ncbi:hypothetical protein E4U30_000660 [Claviceps sp. LM220 group G6]|nr:hypothetical protein E4U30_000660 [Claviceps sp. LM220 group G6]
MTCDRTLMQYISEDGTVSQHGTVSEALEDGTEAIGEIEYVDDEEFNHKTLELCLFSARVDRYKDGMHPEVIRAETVHYASAIPPYPISSDKGYAYVIDTTRIDEAVSIAPKHGKLKRASYLFLYTLTSIAFDPEMSQFRRLGTKPS